MRHLDAENGTFLNAMSKPLFFSGIKVVAESYWKKEIRKIFSLVTNGVVDRVEDYIIIKVD